MNFQSILKSALLFFACFALSRTSYGQNFQGDKAEIDKILMNIKSFSRCYMSLDYECLAEAYSTDARILPPGADIIEGRQAIKKRWTLPEGISIPLHKITPVEIKIIGDYAYDVGYYEGRTKRKDGSEASWKGKYVIVWKKEAGNWKIYLDAWNRVEDAQ